VAFLQNGHLFDTNCQWLGFIEDGDDVYSAGDGSYMGTLSTDDRLIVNTKVSGHSRLRPLKPLRPLRPLGPLRRLRMSRLPHGYRDHFETEVARPSSKLFESLASLVSSGQIPPETAAQILVNVGSRVFSEKLNTDIIMNSQLKTPSGVFLGNVNRNKFDADSLVNPYSQYVSPYSAESIFNKFSQYGSPYGTESPYNKFSTTPPMFVKNGEALGYVTVNQYLTPRIDPDEFIKWLGNTN
jgi:hypothetical protein